MRIVGWPEESDPKGGILPLSIADVDLHGTPDELRVIANFLLKAASELELAQANNSELSVGIEIGNSNPTAGVGVWFNVVRQADE